MRRIKSVFMVAILVAFCLLICSGCGKRPLAVLKVALLEKQEDITAYAYYTVYDTGKTEKTDPFAEDDTAEFYTAGHDDFKAEIVNNQLKVTLQNTLLINPGGEIIEADKSSTELMQAVADAMRHDIAQLTIIKVENQMFAFVGLNVNLFDPCELYRYNMETKTLSLLCRWDNVDIMGVAVP